jgi:hypothetical protein
VLVPLPALVEVLVCDAALVTDAAELPLSLHAAKDKQARKISGADKRVVRIMKIP